MAEPLRQIIALGGGGFSMEARNPRLDDFIISCTGTREPRLCFLPTASGDAAHYITNFYNSFPIGRVQPSHLALVNRTRVPRDHLLAQDIIYVGGGNTANMLAIWRVHGVDKVLREAWERGIVLCGISAGMICWFEASCTDSFGPLAALRDGLGFLPGSACPHYHGELDRRPTFHRLIAEGLPGGVAADDGVALHFVGTELKEVVASRSGVHAYRVERRGGEVIETLLSARLLPDLPAAAT